MADYTNSKTGLGATFPQGQIESDWTRTEPLLTPDVLQARFLFGIPLVSGTPDPLTKKVQVFTADLLQDFIESAVSDLELELGISLFPSQREQRLAFDRAEFRSFGFFRLPDRPISSIESLRIEASDGTSFFEIPTNWIETGNMHQGQINILPLSPGASTGGIIGGAAAGLFLMTLGSYHWIPAYWTVTYTVGFADGNFPRAINNLIGIEAAMKVLSVLAPTHQKTSTSLSIDGLSQSVGQVGPQLYETRLQALEAEKKKKIGKIKAKLGLKFMVGNV